MQHDSFPDFLASERTARPAAQCLFQVIPAPRELTVSYGGGTAAGPAAMLEASAQLEAWDGFSNPAEEGIFTHPPAHSLEQIEASIAEALRNGHIPVLLGGEHTVSVGAFRALAKRERPVGIVQFDAHADLRDTYEGSPLSHACVMRRALELGLPVIQLGIRALSEPEAILQQQRHIPCFTAYDININGMPADWIPPGFPEEVYITFDIDALDSAIMPATGTPEPGGLDWWQATRFLTHLAAHRTVIGFDCVELAPIPDQHAPSFTAARLIYNIMGLVSRARKSRAEKAGQPA